MTEKLHLLQPLSSSSNIHTPNMSQAHQTMYIPIQPSNPDSESAYFFSSQLEEGDSPILPIMTDDLNNVNSLRSPIGLLTPSIIKQRHDPSTVPLTSSPQQEKTFILSTTPRTDLYQHFNPFSSIQEFFSYSNTESSNSSINNKVYSNEISSSHKKENHQHMNTIPRVSSHDHYMVTSHKRRHSSPTEFDHNVISNSAPLPIVAIPVPITTTNNNTVSKCYAGGAFHNSPAPDTLPIPEFVTTNTQSKSVPVSPKLTAKSLSPDKITVLPSSPVAYNVNTSPKIQPQNRKVKSPLNKNKPSPKPSLKPSPSNENLKADRIRNKSNHKPKVDPVQIVNISATKYTELLANDLRRMLNIVPAQVI